MTAEEVMKLIEGETPMPKKPYETLDREEVLELLELHNLIDDMLGDASDMFDVNLSQLAALQKQMFKFRNRFRFRPQESDTGDHPAHWKPHVLHDDERAWYYKGEKD